MRRRNSPVVRDDVCHEPDLLTLSMTVALLVSPATQSPSLDIHIISVLYLY